VLKQGAVVIFDQTRIHRAPPHRMKRNKKNDATSFVHMSHGMASAGLQLELKLFSSAIGKTYGQRNLNQGRRN
jgi:hypothetical protein